MLLLLLASHLAEAEDYSVGCLQESSVGTESFIYAIEAFSCANEIFLGQKNMIFESRLQSKKLGHQASQQRIFIDGADFLHAHEWVAQNVQPEFAQLRYGHHTMLIVLQEALQQLAQVECLGSQYVPVRIRKIGDVIDRHLTMLSEKSDEYHENPLERLGDLSRFYHPLN